MSAGQLGIVTIGRFAGALCWFDRSLRGRGQTGKAVAFRETLLLAVGPSSGDHIQIARSSEFSAR